MDVADLPLLSVANLVCADLQLASFLGSLHISVHYGDKKPCSLIASLRCSLKRFGTNILLFLFVLLVLFCNASMWISVSLRYCFKNLI